MSCCRSQRVPPAAKTYDSPLCSKCSLDLKDLYLRTAVHQTRGGVGGTVLVRVNCPQCNAVNAFRMNVQRKTTL